MLFAEFLKAADPSLSGIGGLVGRGLSSFLASKNISDKTLIIRPGGMGDLICLQLAVENLQLPTERFHWLIEKRSADWAKHMNLDYSCIDDGIISQVRGHAGGYKVVINTEQRFGLSQAFAQASRSGEGKIFAFSTNRGSSQSHVHGVEYDWDESHEVIEFGKLVATALGLKPFEKIKPLARRKPASLPPIVAVAGLQSPTRNLPIQTWTKLVGDWVGERNMLIASSPADKAFARQIAEQFPSRAQLFEGGFDALCNAVAMSEELFSMDGGMVHVASYYGVKTTAIFTSGRDQKWAPLAESSQIIRRQDLSCQPCTKFGQTPPCPNKLACHELATKEHLRLLPQFEN